MAIAPQILFSAYAVSGVDPSGSRHLDLPDASGFSFIKNLGTGAGEFLDFGNINISQATQTTTDTFAVIARLGELNDMTESVFNMKFWLPDLSSFQVGTFKFQGLSSGTWIPNINLNDASGSFVPSALPSGQNIFRNADPNQSFNPLDKFQQEITASGADDQVTQYQFISVTVLNDAAVKTYGGDAGGFTYRLTFDFK